MTDLAKQNVDKWVGKLKSQTARTTHELVLLGKLYTQAKAALPHGQWLTALSELQISERSAQRLMFVAGNTTLANPTHVADLPAKVGTLEVLARLPKPELEAAITDGRVSPSMTRAEAELLLGKPPAESAGAGDESSKGSSAAPAPALSDPDDHKASGSVGDGGVPATTVPQTISAGKGDDHEADQGSEPVLREEAGPEPDGPRGGVQGADGQGQGRSGGAAQRGVGRGRHGLTEFVEGSSDPTGDSTGLASTPAAPAETGSVPSPSISAPPHAGTAREPNPPSSSGEGSPRAGGRSGPNRRPPAPSNHQEQYAIGGRVVSILTAPNAFEGVQRYLAKHPDTAAAVHDAASRLVALTAGMS